MERVGQFVDRRWWETTTYFRCRRCDDPWRFHQVSGDYGRGNSARWHRGWDGWSPESAAAKAEATAAALDATTAAQETTKPPRSATAIKKKLTERPQKTTKPKQKPTQQSQQTSVPAPKPPPPAVTPPSDCAVCAHIPETCASWGTPSSSGSTIPDQASQLVIYRHPFVPDDGDKLLKTCPLCDRFYLQVSASEYTSLGSAGSIELTRLSAADGAKLKAKVASSRSCRSHSTRRRSTQTTI